MLRIEVEKRADDFIAFLEGDHRVCEAGQTANEAIGKLALLVAAVTITKSHEYRPNFVRSEDVWAHCPTTGMTCVLSRCQARRDSGPCLLAHPNAVRDEDRG